LPCRTLEKDQQDLHHHHKNQKQITAVEMTNIATKEEEADPEEEADTKEEEETKHMEVVETNQSIAIGAVEAEAEEEDETNNLTTEEKKECATVAAK
jgi:hypothetical protein